jgi:tetratricopeptide (TPR) repeat protein
MRSTGPRGMVFVPAASREKLATTTLPDCELWDAHYDLTRRLDKHDHDGAVAALEKMVSIDAEHRLTTYGRGRIAWYDGDRHTLGVCTDQLLKQFPDDQNQWSVKLGLLRENGTRDERLRVLNELTNKPECESVFQHQYIEELLDDPKCYEETHYLLRRRLHSGAVDGRTYDLFARLLWSEGKRGEALAWSRFAACLDDKDESRALNYFYRARALNRTDEVMHMLRDRFIRFKSRSSGPARSLAEALDQLYRPQVAVDVLEQALKARPRDSDLKLYATEFLMRVGRHADAARHLEECRATTHAAEWQATAARLAVARNRLDEAITHAEAALAADPLNLNTQRFAAELLADTRGSSASFEQLQRYVQRFPDHQGLRALLVERASEFGPEESEAEVREFLALHSYSSWAWRELGISLVEQRRWQDAHAAIKKAYELEPNSEVVHLFFGLILRGVGKHAKAMQAVHQSLQLSADYSVAIFELMKLCDTLEERQNALKQVFGEMKRQVIRGESLHTFRYYAAMSFDGPDVLRMLLEARTARPDLWQTWSVLVQQLLAMKRTDDALKYATTAANRFPLLPQALIDLADVHRERGTPAEERATLDRALAINSRNGELLRRSAEGHHRAGQFDAEKADIERACASEPRNVTHRGALAEFLWAQGQRREAIDTIGAAIERDPQYEWGWQQLTNWASVRGEPQRVIELTTKIASQRPKSPRIWLQRARILSRFPEQHEQSLKAVERALELDPRSVEAHSLRATILADHGQFEAALAACKPAKLEKRSSLQLAARAAVIQYQRGDRRTAITEMQRVVEQDPRYSFAWTQLADWRHEEGDYAESLACAKRLLEIAPDVATSWGYVAHSLLASNEREEAARHLKRAIELDPAYVYAGQNLVSLQIEDKQFEDGLATLRIFGPHISGDERYSKEALLHCLRGQHGEALLAFQHACREKLEGVESIFEAADALLQAGQATKVKEVLLRECGRPGHSPFLGRILAEIYLRAGSLSEMAEFCDSLDPTTQTFAEAAATFAEILGDAHATNKLAWLVSRHGDSLKRHNASWSAVGAGLQRSGLHAEARSWMQDWRQRADLQPHMLGPLAFSLVVLGETREATAVAELTSKLPIAPATDALFVIGACASVVQGDIASASRWLSQIRPNMLSSFYANLYALIRTVESCLQDAANGSRWKDVEAKWRAALKDHNHPANDDLFQVVVSRCGLLLAQQRTAPRKWLAERFVRQFDRKRQKVFDARQRSYV